MTAAHRLVSRRQSAAAFGAACAVTLSVLVSVVHLAGSHRAELRLAASQGSPAVQQVLVLAHRAPRG